MNTGPDLFLRVTYQLSSLKQETGKLLPRSERKKKKSCNKNSIKKIRDVRKIYILIGMHIYIFLISQYLLKNF